MCYAQEIGRALVQSARKGHRCTWCGETIEKTKTYFRIFTIVDGDPVHSKMHPECDEAAKEWPYDSCWFDGEQPRGRLPDEALEYIEDEKKWRAKLLAAKP